MIFDESNKQHAVLVFEVCPPPMRITAKSGKAFDDGGAMAASGGKKKKDNEEGEGTMKTSETKQAEAALRESEAAFRALTENVAGGIWSVDRG